LIISKQTRSLTSKKTIKKTKLIRLITTFSSLEWKRFGRFVQSPYHNSNQSIVKFYTILKKYFPFESEGELGQEVLFKKVFGKEAFKASKLQNLCSDLYGLAEDFLIDVYLKKEQRKRKKILIEVLGERDYTLFEGASQKLINEIEAQHQLLDENDYLLLYQLYNELHHHIEKDKYTMDRTEVKQTGWNLDAFYEVAKVQLTAENMGYQNMLTPKKVIKNSEENLLLQLFHSVSELYQSKETNKYFQLKEQVLKHWDKLKIKHKRNLLVHLINFSFTNILIQKEFGHTESFELYKISIEEQLFIINGKMRDVEFLNIGMIGFGLKQYEWTDNFIQEHQIFLPDQITSFAIPLLNAYKANFQKNYELVIELLSQLHPNNQLNYQPKIKSLLVRAYFEGVMEGKKDYQNLLNYEIMSFRKMMLRNDKLSQIKVDAYLNFLDLIKNLLNIVSEEPYDLKKLQTIELLLSNTTPLTLKHWLSEKVTELKRLPPHNAYIES